MKKVLMLTAVVFLLLLVPEPDRTKASTWDYEFEYTTDGRHDENLFPVGIDIVAGQQYQVEMDMDWEKTGEDANYSSHEVRLLCTYNICVNYGMILNETKQNYHLSWTFTANRNCGSTTNWLASVRGMYGNLKISNYIITSLSGDPTPTTEPTPTSEVTPTPINTPTSTPTNIPPVINPGDNQNRLQYEYDIYSSVNRILGIMLGFYIMLRLIMIVRDSFGRTKAKEGN